MVRATLKQCIDLFNSNPMMQCTAIRGMEQLGEWETASIYWRKLGMIQDVEACDMIVQATNKGNRYRELTQGIYERYEYHEINNVELHALLSEAHKKVYV